MNIPVNKVLPNPDQPRTIFDEMELHALAQSIQNNGLIQPIVVEPAGDQYILIDGERRLRAIKILELTEILWEFTTLGEYMFDEMALPVLKIVDDWHYLNQVYQPAAGTRVADNDLAEVRAKYLRRILVWKLVTTKMNYSAWDVSLLKPAELKLVPFVEKLAKFAKDWEFESRFPAALRKIAVQGDAEIAAVATETKAKK